MHDSVMHALKKIMHGHKGKHIGGKEEVMEAHADKERDQDSDLAPDLHKEGPGGDAISGDGKEAHQAGSPMVAPTADDGDQELHQKIMEALMGKGSALGRSANSLSERAHAKHTAHVAGFKKG